MNVDRIMRPKGIGLAALCLLAGAAGAAPPAGGPSDGPRPGALRLAPAQLGPLPLLPSLARRRTPDGARARSLAGDLGTAVDQCVAADMAAHGTPGAAVAVILDGVEVVARGYGVKHRTMGGAVDAQTQFRIGSITKQMTAAAVLQQVERGRVRLADPVTVHVPELALAPPYPTSEITVWHLLTHTSGIPDLPFDLDGPTGDGALAAWAADLDSTRLHAPAGEFWNYSNANYSLAGLVAERASGTPYAELVRDELWEPAGLLSTTLSPTAVVARGNYTWGHFRSAPGGAETVYAPTSYDSAEIAPAGLAFSTAPDLARWALLLIDGGGPVLTPASATAMQARQASLDYRPDLAYGLGVFAEDFRGVDLRQHGGNVPGWGSMLLWAPERRFAVAVLANTFESLTEAAYCIADAALAPTGPEPPDDTTDPATWDRYLGSYAMLDSLGDPLDAAVAWKNGTLTVTFTDPENPRFFYATRLEQVYHDTFLIDGNGDGSLDLDLTFVRTAPGLAPTRWLRNRSLVGELRSAPQRRTLAGAR